MTIDDAMRICLRQLHSTIPVTLEYIASTTTGAQRGRGGRRSNTAYKRYQLLGRALQALKKTGAVRYLGKAAGGPGWVRGRS